MPSYLVIGCANFYGRSLIQLLCQQQPQPTIRGVDKVLPELASFPQSTLELFKTFDYRMGNLRSREFLEQSFAIEGSQRWDYVFNFAAEQKFGQTEQVYEQDVLQLSQTIAQLAMEHKAGSLVHLSTAHIYKPSSKRHKEDDKLDSQSVLARCHVQAETKIRETISSGAPLIILRPALCYGPGDRQNAVPMLIMAQLSKESKDKMPVLWDKDTRINTVHVTDVARAALASAHGHKTNTTAVFNLSDPGDTTNAQLAKTVTGLFGVEAGFQNSAINFFAKRLKTSELAEEVNESLLGPWIEFLDKHGIANSPLSPYLDCEHPYFSLEAHPLGIDGSRITKTIGIEFEYKYPSVSPDALRAMVEEFQELGLWPKASF